MLQSLKIVKQTSYDSFHIRKIHNLINGSKKKNNKTLILW